MEAEQLADGRRRYEAHRRNPGVKGLSIAWQQWSIANAPALLAAAERERQPLEVTRGDWKIKLNLADRAACEALIGELLGSAGRERRAMDVIDRLLSVQNGCPLPKYQADFNSVNNDDEQLLREAGYFDQPRHTDALQDEIVVKPGTGRLDGFK